MIKDIFDDATSILKHNASLAYLNDQLKTLAPKTTHLWQISLLTDLMSINKDIQVDEVLETVTPRFKQLFTNENFGSTVNFSQILALGAFFA
jgi:hypothetical protein